MFHWRPPHCILGMSALEKARYEMHEVGGKAIFRRTPNNKTGLESIR